MSTPALQGAHLRVDVDAAVDREAAQVQRAAERHRLLVDLLGQLARRRDDQRAHAAAGAGREALEDRQQKGRGLAGAGLGESHHVAAFEGVRDGLLLDRGRLLPAECLDAGQNTGVELELLELHERLLPVAVLGRIHRLREGSFRLLSESFYQDRSGPGNMQVNSRRFPQGAAAGGAARGGFILLGDGCRVNVGNGGAMATTRWAAGIGLVFFLAQAGQAFGDSKSCLPHKVGKPTFDVANNRRTYTVFRACVEYSEGPYASSNITHGMTYKGVWDGNAKKATEEIDDHFRYFYDGALNNDVHYKKTATADCPSDPWLDKVSCSNDTISQPLPMYWVFDPPYPIGAQPLTDFERAGLRNNLATAQRKIAPQILLPKPNAKYTNGQLLFEGKVLLPDADNPGAWKVEIETNMDQSQPGAHNVPIKAAGTVTGLATAWIYKDLPYDGFWFVRARSTSPNHASDWSGQVRFEIAGSKGPKAMISVISKESLAGNFALAGKTGALGPPPNMAPTIASPTQGQVVTGAVTIRAVLPPGAGTQVVLEFELSQGGVWQKQPVLSGYDTSSYPAGYPLAKSKFQALGAWRIKAKAAALNAPWSGRVTFEVK